MRALVRTTPRRHRPGRGAAMTAEPQRSFKLALVGCGRISRNHFDALRAIDGLELTAVCDVDEDRSRTAGEEQGVPWFRSLDDMLRQADCDVVTICTPSGLHAVHGVAA